MKPNSGKHPITLRFSVELWEFVYKVKVVQIEIYIARP